MAACILSISAMLFILYSFSPINEEIYRGNFNRKFLTNYPLIKVAEKKLDAGDFYISGVTKERVYVTSRSRPFNITIADSDLSNLTKKRITLTGIDSLKEPYQFKTNVEPPNFTLTNGVMALIMQGDTINWTAKKIFKDTIPYYFDEAIPAYKNSFALRSLSTRYNEFDLAIRNPNDTPSFKFNHTILEKQIDGQICISGNMVYNKQINKSIYVYTYRNQYLIIDEDFKTINRLNTIDTFKTAHLDIGNSKDGSTKMLGGSSFVTNIKSCSYDKYLFINSNVLAKNEDQITFLQSSVIDIYDIEKGEYLSSFHIPNYLNNHLSDFMIVENHLTAIFGKHLVVYELDKTIYPDPTKI